MSRKIMTIHRNPPPCHGSSHNSPFLIQIRIDGLSVKVCEKEMKEEEG